ncbi:MAG TPA: 3-dehydroquinate synthase family protein [Sphingomicrobium sp.]|nr:3-dehydroquinate synthase family protein [Sphingomicrobium sp.]
MSREDKSVIVGDLAGALGAMAEIGGGHRLPLISDAHVHALHGHRLAPIVDQPPILIPRGEQAKSWAVLAAIIDELALRGIARGTPIIAFGGGSVGDVAGLAASLYKRGSPVIQLPTTLLAQVDSAIGGKTAIDSGGLKNVAGTFHPPALVVADPGLLDTLDERQLAAGFAEVVKYGLIDDPNFFAWCEAHGRALLAGDRDARAHAVRHCLAAKARLVRPDPLDRGGSRTLLNLGHSFAHAIESAAGIGRLLHGEAVAAGLVLAFRFSAFLRLCPEVDVERVAALLASAGLPTRLDQVGVRGHRLLEWIDHDKKNAGGDLVLVLVHGIGRAFIARPADRAALRDFLAAA